MNLEYTDIIDNSSGKKAQMKLFGQIGYDVNGNGFAQELDWLSKDENIKEVEILVNSVGGSVFEGYSIVGTIMELKEKKYPLTIKNIGVAYSMAGIILACGYKGKRKIVDYGSVMIHDPKFRGMEIEEMSESQKQMYETTANSLATILSNSCGKEKDKIRSLMSAETTMSATEAVEMGFVDEVISTGKEIKNTNSNFEKMAACAALHIDNQINNNMKLISLGLGLQADASEKAIVEAIANLKEKSNSVILLENKLEEKENLIEALKAENAELKIAGEKVKAETLINQAISEGKISQSVKDDWFKLAVNNYTQAEKMINSLTANPISIDNSLEKEPKVEKKENQKELADKYEKMLENPLEMDNMEPEELKRIENAWIELNGKVDIVPDQE